MPLITAFNESIITHSGTVTVVGLGERSSLFHPECFPPNSPAGTNYSKITMVNMTIGFDLSGLTHSTQFSVDKVQQLNCPESKSAQQHLQFMIIVYKSDVYWSLFQFEAQNSTLNADNRDDAVLEGPCIDSYNMSLKQQPQFPTIQHSGTSHSQL